MCVAGVGYEPDGLNWNVKISAVLGRSEGRLGLSKRPTNSDLAAIAVFAECFEASGFLPGEWINPPPREDGVFVIGWWSPSDVVAKWHKALYDHNIMDPDSDYLGKPNVEFVRRVTDDPSLITDSDLSSVRRVLTYLARAERHTGGGPFEEAFGSGMAQAATRRLGELSE